MPSLDFPKILLNQWVVIFAKFEVGGHLKIFANSIADCKTGIHFGNWQRQKGVWACVNTHKYQVVRKKIRYGRSFAT